MKKYLLSGIVMILSNLAYSQMQPEWLTFFNGPTNVNESIENVMFDNFGNTYLSGYGYETSLGQGHDFLTVKGNSSGTEQWTKVYNGPQNNTDRPFGLFVDNAGNVYLTGTSWWSANGYKIVTIKYSPTGDMLWISAYDSLGTAEGEAHDVTVDINGNVYVTGRISPANNSYYDLALIKMNQNGSVLDYSYYGKPLGFTEDGTNIITDDDGNIFVAGTADNSGVGPEAIVIKYNSSLDTLWTVHINGTNNALNEFAIDFQLDDSGNVYVLCRLQNTPGSTDFSLTKINSSGEIIWREDYDEAGGQDIPEDMVMDNQGNIYVTGRVRRSGGGGYNDFAIIKYNNAGVQQWVSYYDGPNNLDDDPIAINFDSDGNIYVCGESNRSGGNFKFIVVKYTSAGIFDWEYVYDINESSKAIGIWPDNSGFVYAAGEGVGQSGNQDLMVVKLSAITGVETENSLPVRFDLLQNFPNPFNPVTKIKWLLPAAAHHSIKVFDILGREISVLVDEYREAGDYELDFNGSNLSSGIYYYQLKTENYFQVKKMLLIK
jgi:uncharacterized delta-60 repeat protein